jgi:hypothetical protein
MPKKLVLFSQTAVCFLKMAFRFLISVYLASKSNYCFLKLRFAFSFQYIQQAKATIAFSNWSLLSHFGIFSKQKQLLLSQTAVCFLICVILSPNTTITV